MTDQQHRFALELLEQLPMDGWDTVLDIGAGPGYQAQWFAQQGKSVTAFDMVPPRVDVRSAFRRTRQFSEIRFHSIRLPR